MFCMTFFFPSILQSRKVLLSHRTSMVVCCKQSKMCIVAARWLARVFRKPVCINVEEKKRRCQKNLQSTVTGLRNRTSQCVCKHTGLSMLACKECTSATKDFDLQRHFKTKHPSCDDIFSADLEVSQQIIETLIWKTNIHLALHTVLITGFLILYSCYSCSFQRYLRLTAVHFSAAECCVKCTYIMRIIAQGNVWPPGH